MSADIKLAPSGAGLPELLLRARLAFAARGPLWCAALLLCVLGGASLAWLLPQRALMAQRQAVALGLIRTPPRVLASAPVLANQNLTRFYATLGEQRYAEEQVKTLFALAAKTGLTLSQGEYKSAFDQGARVYTYQITLPVKGSYHAVWRFAMLALGAMPFASLDEISFKRESIGEAGVEARLRLTLYLGGRAAGAAS